jgi:hypothetical protein
LDGHRPTLVPVRWLVFEVLPPSSSINSNTNILLGSAHSRQPSPSLPRVAPGGEPLLSTGAALPWSQCSNSYLNLSVTIAQSQHAHVAWDAFAFPLVSPRANTSLALASTKPQEGVLCHVLLRHSKEEKTKWKGIVMGEAVINMHRRAQLRVCACKVLRSALANQLTANPRDD